MRYRRWLRFRTAAWAGVCLALGLVTSIALAWGAAIASPLNRQDTPGYKYNSPWGPVFVDRFAGPGRSCVSLSPVWTHTPPDEFPADTVAMYPEPDRIAPARLALFPSNLNFALPRWATLPDGSTTAYNISTHSYGWPRRCLCGVESTTIMHSPSKSWNRSERAGFWRPSSAGLGGNRTYLPVWPIWPGLAADTLAIGAGWWTIGATLSTALRQRRRLIRRLRDQCPQCGYSLRGAVPIRAGSNLGQTRCPECGHIS